MCPGAAYTSALAPRFTAAEQSDAIPLQAQVCRRAEAHHRGAHSGLCQVRRALRIAPQPEMLGPDHLVQHAHGARCQPRPPRNLGSRKPESWLPGVSRMSAFWGETM